MATHTAQYPENLIANPSTILQEAIQEDYNRELEWLWIADVVPNNLEREYCLRRALYISPQNHKIRHALNVLLKRRFQKKQQNKVTWRFLKWFMASEID